MADKRNSYRSVKLFHVCLEHWSFDARLMFDGASFFSCFDVFLVVGLMVFWIVWSSWSGHLHLSLQLLAGLVRQAFQPRWIPFCGGTRGDPWGPQNQWLGEWENPWFNRYPSFCSLQSAQESAEMLLDLLLQSLLLLQQCRILRLQLVHLERSRPNQPPKSQGKIYTQANAEKKMINPFLMVPNCPCFFFKLSWVFLPVAPHWQNHLLEAVLWASRRTSSTTQPGRSQVGNPSWESKQTQWPNPSVFIKS